MSTATKGWSTAIGLLLALVGAAFATLRIREQGDQRPRLEASEAGFHRFAVPTSHYRLVPNEASAAAHAEPNALVTLQVQNPSPSRVERPMLQLGRSGIYEIARQDGKTASGRFAGEFVVADALAPQESAQVSVWLDPEAGGAPAVPSPVLRYEGGELAVSLAKNRIPWVNFLLAFVLVGALVTGITYAMFTAVTFVELRKQVDRLTGAVDVAEHPHG
ncbi:MAG: hypothetical protein U0836_13185 [Pirellulales bacterium]